MAQLLKTTRSLTDDDAEKFTAGLMAEALAAQAVDVKGRIDVEIVDDRSGRIVEKLSGDNYINTTQWNEFAKALQKLAWSWGYQGDSSTVTNNSYTNRDPRYVPTLRNDHLACWTDSTAEDTNDLFAFGEIVAWAHRWSQGSPSTRQGLVNPSLCTLSTSAIKWVWEWTTSNGNGTFQSVGWRRLSFNSNSGDAILYDLALISRALGSTSGYASDPSGASFTISIGGSWTAGAVTRAVPIYYNSGDSSLYFITHVSGNNFKLCSVPVTIGSDSNYTLGTVVDQSAAAIAAGVGGDTVSYLTRMTQGLTRLGASGDWIATGFTGSGTSKRPFIRRVTTGGSVTYDNANSGTYSVESGFIDVTYDGTDLWVIAKNGSTGLSAIHRVASATGTISATISSITSVPAYFPGITTGRALLGIHWDSTNSWLWITTTDGYIFNINTSGVWQGVLFGDTENTYPIASATLSGQHNAKRAQSMTSNKTDFVALVLAPETLTEADDSAHPYSQSGFQQVSILPSLTYTTWFRGRLFEMDGDIWAQVENESMVFNSGSPTGINRLACVAFCKASRPHFATRTLLGSPATKNNTQTMKISYTMTFT